MNLSGMRATVLLISVLFIRNYINKDKALRKMNVLEFVDDGYTGKNMDRPDMQRMLTL